MRDCCLQESQNTMRFTRPRQKQSPWMSTHQHGTMDKHCTSHCWKHQETFNFCATTRGLRHQGITRGAKYLAVTWPRVPEKVVTRHGFIVWAIVSWLKIQEHCLFYQLTYYIYFSARSILVNVEPSCQYGESPVNPNTQRSLLRQLTISSLIRVILNFGVHKLIFEFPATTQHKISSVTSYKLQMRSVFSQEQMLGSL